MICEEGQSKANALVSILAIFGFGLGVVMCISQKAYDHFFPKKDEYESDSQKEEDEKGLRSSATKSETESEQIESYNPLSKKI